LPVSSYPTAIGANSNTGLIYIVNQWSNNVTIVSSTNVLGSISVGFSPMAIGVNPKTGYAYVANRDGPTPVTVLSGTQVLTTITWPDPAGEKQIAVDLSANRAYVLNTMRGELIVLSSTQVIANLFIGSMPSAIAVNSINGYVYVTDKHANTVTVLDDTHVITTLPTIAAPLAIAVNSATGQTYIAGQGITVLSGTKSVATLAVGCKLSKVDIDSSTGRVYALDSMDQTTIVLSGTQVLARLPVGGQPTMVHVNPVNHAAYVGSSTPDSLSIIYGDELNLQSSLVRLTSPADTVVIDFGQPVLTPTVQFTLTPALNRTITWTTTAEQLMIALDDAQPATFYRLQFKPDAYTVSGLKIVVPDSILLILEPFESFLPIVGRHMGCVTEPIKYILSRP
jgi:YVTN family beta-propeller protein